MINEEQVENLLISIIVPCFNCEKYIIQTIESILEQDYSSTEVIIVDDGSTDNSLDLITAYCKQKSTVKIIRQRNQGASAARNNGLSYARGKYVICVDADDRLAKNMLSSLVSAHFDNPNLLLSYCNARSFERSEEIKYYDPFEWKSFLRNNSIPIFAMAKLENMLQIGGFDEHLKTHEDWECWIRMIKNYGAAVHLIEEPLYWYRKRETNDSLTDQFIHSDLIDYTYFYIYHKHYDLYRTQGLAINTLFYAQQGLEHMQQKKANRWYKRIFKNRKNGSN